MVLTATAFSAQAQTTNICDRTQQVVDEILRLTPTEDDKCGSVSVSEMANISGELSLESAEITSLKSGDFGGLTGLFVIDLRDNDLTELPVGIFSSDLTSLWAINLSGNALATLTSNVFSNISLRALSLANNQLNSLPDGIFAGLSLGILALEKNPGAVFRFTVRFEPPELDKDFTSSSVRLTLRVGAPSPVTVPLSIVGGMLSRESLTLARGSTQSDVVMVTRATEKGFLELNQGTLEVDGEDDVYTGFEIVPGPPITVGGVSLRVKVFLEGALE